MNITYQEELPFKILCTRDVHPFFTKGEIYEITNRDPENIVVLNNYLEEQLIVCDDDWSEFDEYFEIYY